MGFSDFILYATLIIFVLYITRINNMWGVSKGTKKAKIDVKVEKSRYKKRIRYLTYLARFEWVESNIGFSLTELREKTYKYKIDRLRWNIEILNRNIKPKEVVGLMKIITLVSCFLGVIGFVLTHSIIFIVFGLAIFLPAIFNVYADMKIADEDKELEDDFPDLYLILYSRLIQRSHTRLAPTLKDYLITLDVMHGGECDNIIKHFVLDLRNNIEVYGDDSIAVMKLREKYTSVMIVNFCNLAVQALNGVDNSDKLLAFKIELNQKRIEQMKQRADKMVARGRRAIYVVYVILFQFILLSWIAKLSLSGGIMSIFGW